MSRHLYNASIWAFCLSSYASLSAASAWKSRALFSASFSLANFSFCACFAMYSTFLGSACGSATLVPLALWAARVVSGEFPADTDSRCTRVAGGKLLPADVGR